MDIKDVQESEEQMWLHAQPKHREFNAGFRELAARIQSWHRQHWILKTKRQRLEELEKREREESALGRFFSRGGKD